MQPWNQAPGCAGATKDRAQLGPAPALTLAAALALALAAAPGALAASGPVPLGRSASAPAELAVSFETAAVVAGKLTPGADAVFWSVAREPQGVYQRIVRRMGVSVVDALGEARFEVAEGAVPLKSVWVIADVASGGVSVAAPEGFVLREAPFPGRAFEAGAPGLVNRLRHAQEDVDFLLVRPGEGAWRLQTHDQAPTDRDGAADGGVLTSLPDFEPVDALGKPPPERFAAGDVLVVVDPRSLRFSATRLLGPPQPKGGRR